MYFFEAFHLKNMQMDLFLISFHFSEKKKKKEKKVVSREANVWIKIIADYSWNTVKKRKKRKFTCPQNDKHFLLN